MKMQDIQKWIVPILATVIFVLSIFAGGIVLGGILMGLMSTLAVWLTIQKLPRAIYNFCVKYPIIADLLFLKLSFAVFALLGSGVMVFCALMVQAVALGLLLKTMKPKVKDVVIYGNNHQQTHVVACG